MQAYAQRSPRGNLPTSSVPVGLPSPLGPARNLNQVNEADVREWQSPRQAPAQGATSPMLQKPLIVPPAWTGLPHPKLYSSRSSSPPQLVGSTSAPPAVVTSPTQTTTRASPAMKVQAQEVLHSGRRSPPFHRRVVGANSVGSPGNPSTGLISPERQSDERHSPVVVTTVNQIAREAAGSASAPAGLALPESSRQADESVHPVLPISTSQPSRPAPLSQVPSGSQVDEQVLLPERAVPKDSQAHVGNGMAQRQGGVAEAPFRPVHHDVYSPSRQKSTGSNAPASSLAEMSLCLSESNKMTKCGAYAQSHDLPGWWERMLNKLEDEAPECPYEFMQEQLDIKLREKKLSEFDEHSTRNLIEAFAAESEQGDRLNRFDALLVSLNFVSDSPSVDPLSMGDTRSRLEHMLKDYDLRPDEEPDDEELVRFVKDALTARAVSREGYRLPHLMLNFDVNQTILMVDSITGSKESEVVNDVLANHAWGKICPEEANDSNSNVGSWKLAHNDPHQECPEPGLINYANYVSKVNLMPTDKSNRDELNAVRKKRRGLRCKFTDKGQPGESLRSWHTKMMDGLQLPKEIVGSPQAMAVGLEGHTRLLLPCFLRMMSELKRAKRSFTLIFRTYGLDLGKVQKEFNAFCEGRHPLFPDTPKFDGTDGEADYRMSLDSFTQSGTWYRERVGGEKIGNHEKDGKENFVLIMGTVAQPPEKPKKGDLLGMAFFEHLKGERHKAARERHAGDLDIGDQDLEGGIEIITGADAVERYCDFSKQARTIALRDFFPYWQSRGQKADGGKPLFIQRSELHKVLPIFFDDNCSKTDAKIIDCRSASRFLSPSRSGRSCIDTSDAYGLFMHQAEPLLSINSQMYYIDKIKYCEANHREVIRRKGDLGELVGRLMQVPKHELKVVIRQAAAASMFHSVRSARRRMSEADWVRKNGLPDIEGADIGGIDTSGAATVEEIRRRCEALNECIGFAYWPEKGWWFPKKMNSGFDALNSTYTQKHDSEKWEWHYMLSRSAVSNAQTVHEGFDEAPRFTGAVKVIGVTWGLACGGEQVVQILKELGAVVINCQKIRMETYFRGTRCHGEILKAMAEEGINVLGKDQEIDHLIDHSPVLHHKMNKIVWPHVKEAVQSKIQELDEETQMGIYYTEDPWMTRRVVVLQANDLVESGLVQFVHEYWYVTAEMEARARALVERGMPPNIEEARLYIQSTKPCTHPTTTDLQFVRIHNSFKPAELRGKVVAEWHRLHHRIYGKPEDCGENVLEIVSPEDELIGAAPVSEVWNQFLWHRMVFVVIRHQKSGGFYAVQRSLAKSYMPGRWDLAVFGRPQCAAVPSGGSASKVASQALQDKLGVVFPEESLVEITKFEYRGALTHNMYAANGRVTFIGIVFEAFLDVPVENLVFNDQEVQRIAILSPNDCIAMQQEQLVPMTSCAYDAYSAYFFLAEERNKVPNIIANPGEDLAPIPSDEDIKSWILPKTDFSSGLYILGLSGHDIATRRDVSALLSELGATVIDCQRIARQCYQKGKACFRAIVNEFGHIIIGEDGEVNQRLLGPLLVARPEMLKSFQELLRPHFLGSLRQAVHGLQEDNLDLCRSHEGAKQLVRKVVVLENAVLTESGLIYFCDEVWTVQNNWDDLTRRRVFCGPSGEFRDTLKVARVTVANDRPCRSSIGVNIKVENTDSMRSDVIWQWQELHRRMYESAEVLKDVDNLKNVPIVEVCNFTGQCMGVAPLPWVRLNCLVHRVAVTVLRHKLSGHFCVTRRSFNVPYLPGALDLTVIGNPGIMEVRSGEAPEDAAERALRDCLGIKVQVKPERVGEFPYQGVWRAWPTLEHTCTIFGVLFEAIVDIPVEEFKLDTQHATEVMYFSGPEVMGLPKDTLSPVTACFFNQYWATRMGGMSIRGRIDQ